MVVNCQKFEFVAPLSTGNQTIVSGLPFNVKAYELFCFYTSADNTFASAGGFAAGMSDGTESGTGCTLSMDAAGTSDTGRCHSNSVLIISSMTNPSAADAVAEHVSFGTGTIVVNWTNAPATAWRIFGIAYGGADLTVEVNRYTLDRTTTGNQAYATTMSNPECAHFLGTVSETVPLSEANGAEMAFGIAVSSTKRAVMGIVSENAVGTMDTWRVLDDTKCLLGMDETTGALDYACDFVSWNANGFTLNHTMAAGSSSFVFYALLFKGAKYDLGVVAKRTTTGDTVINPSGVGSIKGLMLFSDGTTKSATVQSHARISIGVATSVTTEGGGWSGDSDAANSAVCASRTSSTNVLVMATEASTATSSTLTGVANITAMGSNTFTLTYTTATSLVGDIVWWVIGEITIVPVTKTGNLLYNVSEEITPKSLTTRFDILKTVIDTDTFRFDVYKEVIDTDTLRFNVTVPVTDTTTLRFDIYKMITDINTFIYNVYREVTDTDTLKFDIISQPVKTGTLKHDVLNEVSKTGTLKYDIFIEVVKAYSLLHNVSMEIAMAKVLTILYNVSVPLTATNTFRADILQEVTDTNSLRFDIINELIKTNTFIYDVEAQALTAVTKALTTRFNVDVAMLTAKTLTLIHDISQETSTSKTLKYNVFQDVTKSGTLLHQVLQEITDTNTLRYDVTVNVEAAKILIHNILQTVTDTNTLRYDITVPTLAKQIRLLHDIIGEITKTETVKFNVDTIMTKTNSFLFDIYSGLVVIKAFNILFNVDQEFTTEGRSFRFDITKDIAAQTALPYNIDTEVTKTNSLPFEILKELVKTGTFRFNTIQETVKAASMIFNVMQQMVKSGTFVYDIAAIGQVIKAMSMVYNVDKILQTSPRVFNWNISQEVTRTRTFRFDVTVPIETQFDMLYSVFQQVIKGTDIRYDISKAVTKLFIGLYQITQAVTRTKTFKHNIDQETTKTASFIYDVTVPMLTAKAFNLVYDIMVEIESQPKTLNYDIIAQITKSTNLLFDIYNAVMAAIKTATLVYNVDKTMTVSRAMRYDVTVRVDKTIRLIFDLLQKVVDRTVFRYSMESQVTKTRTFRFNVTNELRTESAFIFNVLNTVATENELLFNILASRTKQLKTRYAIQHEVSKTRTLRHNISQLIESTGRTMNWDLLQETDKSSTIRYDISHEIAMRARFKWEMLQELVRQNTIMFNMLQEVPEVDVSFRYDIIAQTTKLLKLYYDIDTTITKAHSLVYSIIPTTVITPKTALHERLLDYIISQYNIADPPKSEILWHEWYNGLADITIDSIFLTAKVIPDRSTLIYKERVYRCAIHVFYRVGKPDETNANNPTEYVNVINHISNILSRSRYNLYYDLGYNVYECKVVDAFEIPDMYDPEHTEPVGKIRHYRFLIDLFYQKLIT